MNLASTITLQQIPDFMELAGSLNNKKPFNISKMTKEAQKYVSSRRAKGVVFSFDKSIDKIKELKRSEP